MIWQKDSLARVGLEIEDLERENEKLRQALTTIERSGAPGASIMASRDDGHSCSWCRGKWTPCPTAIAQNALRRGEYER
jgi:hypothetical protein